MGRTGGKVLAKIREKMPEKRIRCCKNYPQTLRVIQPQFVEIKPAKTYRKHRERKLYISQQFSRANLFFSDSYFSH